ncbi:MAG TPA: hypothetical protein VG367_20900 [Mucilaginibacter sp.]|nr:hypothetical protein [Mucilaginibacter sp.]
MKKFIPVLIVFLMVIFSFRFFEATFLSQSVVNYIVYLFMLFAIAISLRYFFVKPRLFTLPLQMIVISIVFSIVMAYTAWGQSYGDSITVIIPYMVWIFFFYLLHTRVSVKTIENITLFYGGLYAILFFYQLTHTSTILFGRSLYGDEFTVDRGIERIIFPGGGIFVLASFIALNKLTTQKKGRILWAIFVIAGIVIPVLQVTRVFIASVLFIYLLHFLKSQNLYRKIIVFGFFAIAITLVYNSDLVVVKGLKDASKEDASAGAKYVRIEAADYFLEHFAPNTSTKIFGNGAPFYGHSNYGKTIEKINEKGFFLEDVGIIAEYSMFGILSIIALVIIWYKSFTVKIPEQYSYAKYYMWFMLFNCLTTYYIYYPYYLISTVFALYIYQEVYEEKLLARAILGKLAAAGEFNETDELANAKV